MSANQPEMTIQEVLALHMPLSADHRRDRDAIIAALSAMVNQVIGEDEIDYTNYEDEFFGGKKVKRDKLRAEQRQRAAKMGFKL